MTTAGAMIPIRFNPSDYSVMEGVDINAVITLETLTAHPFAFTVTVLTQNGNAVGESCHKLYTSFHISARVCTFTMGLVHKSPPLLQYSSSMDNMCSFIA